MNLETAPTAAPSEFGTDVEALRTFLRGEALLPGDADYDAARAVWNAMIDHRPAVIVRARGAADVIDAVNFARGPRPARLDPRRRA